MCANWWKTNLADNKSVNPLPDLTLRTQKSTIIDFYNRHISHLSHLPPLVTSCGQALLARGVISCDDVSAIASLLLRLLFKAKFKSIINNLCRGARRVGEHISRRQFVCHKPKLGQTMRRHCHRRRHRLLLRWWSHSHRRQFEIPLPTSLIADAAALSWQEGKEHNNKQLKGNGMPCRMWVKSRESARCEQKTICHINFYNLTKS